MLTIGDCREWATTLAPGSVQTIVTSPPYWKLRSYLASDHPDKPREFGNEATPEEFVENLVGLFRLLRPALHDSGTCWVNLGDSYAGNAGGQQGATGDRATRTFTGAMGGSRGGHGLKDKDLVGIPWLVAFALRADGWYLRSDIIWHKPSPMPESVRDRPTRSHEYLFLLSKGPRYYYDQTAIAEEAAPASADRYRFAFGAGAKGQAQREMSGSAVGMREFDGKRNKRDVWTVTTAQFGSAHFATFPPALIRPCILAGTSARGACVACGAPWRRVVERVASTEARKNHAGNFASKNGASRIGGFYDATSETLGWEPSCQCGTTETRPCVVADPFAGSGTTAMVAVEEGRHWVACDLDARAREWTRARLDGRQVRLDLALGAG